MGIRIAWVAARHGAPVNAGTILYRVAAGAAARLARLSNFESRPAVQLARLAGLRAAPDFSRSLRPQPGGIIPGCQSLSSDCPPAGIRLG